MGAIGDIGLRPRDMLKFGLLYFNEGVWNDTQIVPAHWVRESTLAKIHPRPSLGYGYFWWTKDFQWKGKSLSSFFCLGLWGPVYFCDTRNKVSSRNVGEQMEHRPRRSGNGNGEGDFEWRGIGIFSIVRHRTQHKAVSSNSIFIPRDTIMLTTMVKTIKSRGSAVCLSTLPSKIWIPFSP
jgi:hypothetical protein